MLIYNVEFQPVKNKFLSKLKKNVKTIKNTKELLIKANKLVHFYKMEKGTHNKYLTENITKILKKSNESKVNEINTKAKRITAKFRN